MKEASKLLFVVIVIVLSSMACDLPLLPTPDSGPQLNTPPTEPPEPPPPQSSCDPVADEIHIAGSASNIKQVGGGSYPDNCSLFCMHVPPGYTGFSIWIQDFSVDLDLYVDTSLSILDVNNQGQWSSTNTGTEMDGVDIAIPGAEFPTGPLYIQVCSYSGVASSFTLNISALTANIGQ